MTQKDIIKIVAKKTGKRQDEVKEIVYCFLESIKEQLILGFNVSLYEFANFYRTVLPAKTFTKSFNKKVRKVPRRHSVKVKLSSTWVNIIKSKPLYDGEKEEEI